MENQRIRISKQMLKNALLNLLEEKDIRKVTVYELCREAQINRTTFYRYYGSIYDVIDEIKDEFFRSMEELMLKEDVSSMQTLEATLVYARQNRRLILILMSVYPQNPVLEELMQRSSIQDQIRQSCFRELDGWQQEYAATYAIYGSYEIIAKWLTTENDISAHQIASLIMEINRRYES